MPNCFQLPKIELINSEGKKKRWRGGERERKEKKKEKKKDGTSNQILF